MLRNFFLSFFLVLPGFLCFAEDGGYKIKVKVNGVRDSACYLANYYGDKQYLKDTAIADKNGNLLFEDKKSLPGGIYLVVIPGRRYFEFIVDKQQSFSLETDTVNFVKNMKVKGSAENEMYYSYLNFISGKHQQAEPLRRQLEAEKDRKSPKAESLRKELGELDKEVKAYWNKIVTEYPNSFMAKVFIKPMMELEIPEAPKLPNGKTDSTFAYRYYKEHYFDHIDFSDDRILRTPLFHNKLDQYFKNVLVQIPDSIIKGADALIEKAKANDELFKYVVWYITYNYEVSNVMGMDAVFVHVVEKHYQKPRITWLDSTQFYRITAKAKTMKPLLLGKKAPPLVLPDTSGNYHSLYSLKNKYVVLVFWDPDCGHCQKEVPKLAAAYDSIKARGGEVFAANGAVEEEKWKKFIKKHNLRWINGADIKLENPFRQTYDLNVYPQLYILNESKEIIARKLSPEQIVDFLDRYSEMEKRKKEAGIK
jgi:peroxiredoxin